MRPTDENQSPSMRPNLISPRRVSTSGEDSILAMLEREPLRKRGTAASGTRLAWYGASAAVAMALTGALVWMAANNDGIGRDVPDSVLAEAGKGGQGAPPAAGAVEPSMAPGTGAALIQVAMAAPAPAPEVNPPRAAVVVEQAPAPGGVPPLRLLKPAPAPSRVPVPAAKPSARAAAAAAPRPAAPEARPPARPAVAAVARKPRPALLAKSAGKPAPAKVQRGLGGPNAAEAGVDADVALISAVIVHANGHAPEGSQMTELLCPNDSCQSRPPRH